MHRSIRALGIMVLACSFITVGIAGPAYATSVGSVRSEDAPAPDVYADTTNPGPDAVDAAPEAPPADLAPPVDAGSAPDEASASVIALAFDHPVIVDDKTTETEQVEAQPDGTFQLTSNSLPVRVQRDDAWVDVDPTLTVGDDGMVEPAATAVPVRFSGGGDETLAQVQLPTGEWMSEAWDLGSLPTPVLEGAAATYPEVLPDVDLKLTATATGMNEVLVIKTAAAAANPDLATLDLSMGNVSIAKKSDGATVAAKSNATGLSTDDTEMALRSTKPHFWDSSVAGSGPDGPAGGQPSAAIDATVSDDTISLDVGAVTAKPGLTYPLYIDPSWTGGNIRAWYIDRTYPNTSFLDGSNDGRQFVGYTATSPELTRSFWDMDTSAVRGKEITDAHFSVLQTFASTCNETVPTDLYWVKENHEGGTWANSPDDILNGFLDMKKESHAGQQCPGAAWVGFAATRAVIGAAASSSSLVTLALLVENEDDPYSWREYAVGATLTVTYNSYPNVPTNLRLTSPVRGCGTAANPAFINPNVDFTAAAYISDPDPGDTAKGLFYVSKGTDLNQSLLPTSLAPFGYYSTTDASAPGDQSVKIPAHTIANNTLFAVAVAAWDTRLWSAKSAWCYYKTDSDAPNLPTLPAQSSIPVVTVGQPLHLTFHDTPSDHVVFEYWWTHTQATEVVSSTPVPFGNTGALPACGSAAGGVQYACADANGNATVTTAPVDTSATLWVAALDAAGNLSMEGTRVASGVEVDGAADTARVNFSKGHGWLSSSLSTSSVPNPFPDANTTGTGTNFAPQALTLGAGFSTSTMGDIPNDGRVPVLSLPGFIALDEVRTATDRAVVAEADVPPGYGLVDAYLGHIAPVITGDNGVGPSGTVPLYSCRFTNGDEMTSLVNGCGDATATQKSLGYIWTSAAAVPAGYTAQQLYRCSTVASGEHFDTVGPSGASCEGQHLSAPVGWVVNLTAEKTAGPVVDTSGSYSVSAWVHADVGANSAAYRTIASQAGNPSSAFYLQEAAGGALRFCVKAQLSPFNTDCATAPTPIDAGHGSWTFVTGIWDSVNRQVRLLVGDSINPVAVTSHIKPPSETSTTGPLSIGSAITNGGRANQWSGMIANPTVFPGVISVSQRHNLSVMSDPNQL